MAYFNKIRLEAKYDNGLYGDCEIDDKGHLKTAISSKVTAFGDALVAQLTPIIQGHFNYNINTDIINTNLIGSGSVTQENSMAFVRTNTTTASSALLTSRRQIRYQNGVGTNMRFTALFSSPVVGGKQYIGFGNDTDGLFYGYSGTTFGIIYRNNSIDTFIPQTSWNEDKFDGTGTSGANLVLSNGNVFEISMQWLGFGNIYFNIEHNNEGDLHSTHTLKYANSNIVPSLTNPNFPFYIFVDNGGTTTDLWIKNSSYAAFIEGIENLNTGLINSISASRTTTTIANVLTIRNKTLFNGKTNRHTVHPQTICIACEGTKPVECQVILNAVLGGSPSWTSLNTNNSIVEYDTSATISGGKKYTTLFLGKSDSKIIDLTELSWELYPSETFTFYARSINDSNSDISISINWRERV